jgi:hypothetical protein
MHRHASSIICTIALRYPAPPPEPPDADAPTTPDVLRRSRERAWAAPQRLSLLCTGLHVWVVSCVLDSPLLSCAAACLLLPRRAAAPAPRC